MEGVVGVLTRFFSEACAVSKGNGGFSTTGNGEYGRIADSRFRKN